MTSQEEADLMLAEDQARRRGEALLRYANDNQQQDDRLATLVCASVIILVMTGLILSMLSGGR